MENSAGIIDGIYDRFRMARKDCGAERCGTIIYAAPDGNLDGWKVKGILQQQSTLLQDGTKWLVS